MTIFRVKHNRNYTVINNTIAYDKRLSYKAKGIYLYAFSRKDDWTFNEWDLINHSKDGKDSVRAGIKELAECGYLYKPKQGRDDKNRFAPVEWYFFEKPMSKEEIKEIITEAENLTSGNKPTNSYTKNISAHISSNNKINTDQQTVVEVEENFEEKNKANPSKEKNALPSVPPPPSQNDVLKKKRILDKIPGLTPDQKMHFVRGQSLETLENAYFCYELQEDVNYPFKWLQNCIRGSWWKDIDPEIKRYHLLWKSLVWALYCLHKEFDKLHNLEIYKDGSLTVITPDRPFTLNKNIFRDMHHVQPTIDLLNKSLKLPKKIIFNILNPRNPKFEVMR